MCKCDEECVGRESECGCQKPRVIYRVSAMIKGEIILESCEGDEELAHLKEKLIKHGAENIVEFPCTL